MTDQTVRRRRVFYLSGFDPRGARHYHGVYRRESAKQSRLNGLKIEVGAREGRRGDPVITWEISSESDGGEEIETTYEFLCWDDIVRNHWPKSDVAMLLEACRTYWHLLIAILTGMIPKGYKIRWAPLFAISYPGLIVITAFVLACAVGVAAGWVSASLAHLPGWAAILIGVMVGLGALRWIRLLEDKTRCYWILRSYGFIRRWGSGQVAEMNDRLNLWARHIERQVKEQEDDEILIIGHSVGTVLLPSLVSRVLNIDPDIGNRGNTVSLMTLGSMIPMAGYIPDWEDYRQQLFEAATAKEIEWIDFSVPTDGTFALLDPVGGAGLVRPSGVPIRPKLLSPRFVKMFSPEEYAKLRRDYLKLHFQYLSAGDQLADYDFFAITAGPIRLIDRFAGIESTGQYFLAPQDSGATCSSSTNSTPK